MAGLNDVLKTLPLLTEEELGQVRQAIMALASLGVAPSSPEEEDSSDERWVLQILCDVLASMGIEHQSVSMLRRSRSISQFRKKLPDVMKIIRKVGPDRNKQRALLTVGIKGLYKSLVDNNIPTSSVVMMRQLYRVPAIIHQLFPGYAASGLLGLIIREQSENKDVRQERSGGSDARPRRKSVG